MDWSRQASQTCAPRLKDFTHESFLLQALARAGERRIAAVIINRGRANIAEKSATSITRVKYGNIIGQQAASSAVLHF